MAVEQTELDVFIRTLPPFDRLTQGERTALVKRMDSVYVSAQNQTAVLDDRPASLYIVRSAVVDRLDEQGQVAERLESGDVLGQVSSENAVAPLPPYAIHQDGILYRLPKDSVDTVLAQNAHFAAWFSATATQQLAFRPVTSGSDLDDDWTRQQVLDVPGRLLVTVDADASIQQTAQTMADAGVSCVPVMSDGLLVGLVTDRDLRNRALARGLDPHQSVSAIMTRSPITLKARQTLLDAMTLISEHNIHHLPILNDQGQPCGMLTTTDLLHQQRNAPLVFIKALHKADSRQALQRLTRALPEQIKAIARSAQDASAAGRVLSAITDTLTRRLIDLWIQNAGEPPAAYAWLAFGSQARQDQTLHSDQDNGLLLADDIPDSARQWFARMADYVCHGLADCGVPLCPGHIMAMNPDWCLTLSEWRQRFSHWVDEPDPKSVMHCMIFFDSRCVAGNASLYRQHRDAVADLGQHPRFLAEVATHIDGLHIPLGLFDRLLGRQPGVIDIKTQGIAVINDLVRLHALHHGMMEAAIPDRLGLLENSPQLAASDVREWSDAWRFLTSLRLRWQLSHDVDDTAPNRIDTHRLSNLERRQLKVALNVLKTAQKGAVQTFRGGF